MMGEGFNLTMEESVRKVPGVNLEVGEVYNIIIGFSIIRRGVYLGKNLRGRGKIFMDPSDSDSKRLPRIYTFDLSDENVLLRDSLIQIRFVNGPYFEREMKKVDLMAINYLRKFKGLDKKLTS